MLESTPRFGVRNVAIHSPVSWFVSIPDSDYSGIVWLYTPNLPRQVGSECVPQARVLWSLKKGSEFDILRFHIKRIPALLTLALPAGDGQPNV